MKPRARSNPVRRAETGFTLIELMVAVAILAIVAVLAWQGLDEVMRSKAVLEVSLENERSVAQLFDQIAIDARAAVPDAVLGQGAVTLSANGFTIIRMVRIEGAAPRWQVVVYRNDGGVIVRATSQLISDRGAVPLAIGQTQTASGVELMRGASAIHASLYRAGLGWNDALGANAINLPTITPGAAVTPPPLQGVLGLRAAVSAARASHPFIRTVLVGQ